MASIINGNMSSIAALWKRKHHLWARVDRLPRRYLLALPVALVLLVIGLHGSGPLLADPYSAPYAINTILNHDNDKFHKGSLIRTKDHHELKLLDYDRNNIKYIYPEVIQHIYDRIDKDNVDWSKFGYILYATSPSHICNNMMIIAELRQFKSQAQMIMLVNEDFLKRDHSSESPENKVHETLTKFAEEYRVLLKPVPVVRKDSGSYWTSSFTKLMIFNETSYDRLIYLDSDAYLPHGNLDELFFLPPAKLASNTAYWLLPDKFKDGKDDGKPKYAAKDFGYTPKNGAERLAGIQDLIDHTLAPYVRRKTGHLPTVTESESLTDKVNARNIFTNLYNNLPNYPFHDEFSFTSILLVIQPSQELAERVEKSFSLRKENDFDMDMLNYYVFKLAKSIGLQKSKLDKYKESLPEVKDLLNINSTHPDIPDFLIIPHQVYGSLTSELNTVQDHKYYLAEPMDQPFVDESASLLEFDDLQPNHHIPSTEKYNKKRAYFDLSAFEEQAEKFFHSVKYWHFSDSPIPKPWIKQESDKDYMKARTRCSTHRDFVQSADDDSIVKPSHKGKDCKAGEFWETIHQAFKDVRKSVCGLELELKGNDPYGNDIN